MEEQMMEFIYLILKATHDVIYTYTTWVKTHLWQFVFGWWGIMAAAATVLTVLIWDNIKKKRKATK